MNQTLLDYARRHLAESRDVLVRCKNDKAFIVLLGKTADCMAGALDAGRTQGLTTIGFTGAKGGDMPPRCDLLLRAPSDRTPVIQQIHINAAHIVCGLVERQIAAGC